MNTDTYLAMRYGHLPQETQDKIREEYAQVRQEVSAKVRQESSDK